MLLLDDGLDVDAVATAALAVELRLSTALLVMDRLRVTRPPGVLLADTGGVLFPPSMEGVVGRAPPSVETPDLLEPLESCPESQEE